MKNEYIGCFDVLLFQLSRDARISAKAAEMWPLHVPKAQRVYQILCFMHGLLRYGVEDIGVRLALDNRKMLTSHSARVKFPSA